jgi:hypothetical protein
LVTAGKRGGIDGGEVKSGVLFAYSPFAGILPGLDEVGEVSGALVNEGEFEGEMFAGLVVVVGRGEVEDDGVGGLVAIHSGDLGSRWERGFEKVGVGAVVEQGAAFALALSGYTCGASEAVPEDAAQGGAGVSGQVDGVLGLKMKSQCDDRELHGEFCLVWV